MKIRVLGSHLPNRGTPVAAWAYHAEVYDEVDPSRPVWTCTHNHESPQLAHGCASNWVEGADAGPRNLTEQTA
jgi:hypothetical protein